jgi:hypothetical protein
MGLPAVDINYFAVLVAAIVANVIGAIWYGPLFGKLWMKLMGFTKKDIDKAKKKGMGKSYLLMFVGSLVMAYVLAYFVGILSASTAMGGFQVGFWLWLGLIVPVLLSSVLWEGKPGKLYILNIAYWLVTLEVMGAILAVW